MTPDIQIITPDTKTWRLIRDHPAFQKISDGDVNKVLPFFKLVDVQPDETIIEEGRNPSMDLYLVLEGNLEVIKRASDREGSAAGQEMDRQFTIARLSGGDAIGELSFITGDPRSASIRCVTRSTLLGLDPMELGRLEVEYPHISNAIMKNMLGYVGKRLRQTSANEVKALKVELQRSILNSKSNLFFSYVIGLLCVYNLTIHFITNLSMDANKASVISALIIFTFSSVLILMIRQSKLPMQFFGLTTRNWRPAVKESLLWTALVITSLIVTKWALVTYILRYQNLPVFDFNISQQKYLAFNFILYGLHSPIQEFVARGVLQGSLQHFFTGRNVTIRAIIVSNALFSATHVHLLSGLLGVIVFVPGIFWGWLYSRHDNLIGVSLSHLLIGWTGLFFLNLESLF